MKKGCIAFLIAILIMPAVFADATIVTDQNAYNLGNWIRASASILQDNNFEGLFKLAISCGNYKLQYFLTPISLEANFRTAVNVPEIAAASQMIGGCSLIGSLETYGGAVVQEQQSNSFSITDQLMVLPVNSRIASLPGEGIQITGILNEAFGNNVIKAQAKITLGNNSYAVDAVDGKFNLALEVPKNMKSGKHPIEISASDQKGNAGKASIELEITAVPSYIKTELSGYNFEPGSKVGITSSLYDQADDLINASLDLELTSPSGNNVFRKVIQSNEKIDYEFGQHAEPGIYILAGTYKSLLTQSLINITSIRDVLVKYNNESVFIENIGNMLFEDELTFILESESAKYPITKNVKVGPGKIIKFDLSEEVPFGIYDVVTPIKEGLKPISEMLNRTIQNITEPQTSLGSLFPKNEGILADDVTIHDNRPFYKKTASGLSYVSGALVGADGMLTKNPMLAPSVLVVIVLALVVRYARKPIMGMLKGRKGESKKEDNEN